MSDLRPGTPWGDALRAIEPLLAAERARGNVGALRHGDLRDSRPWYQLPFPLDVEAIRAEFEFGEGIELDPRDGGQVTFRGLGGNAIFAVAGGGRTPYPWTSLRRARWWRRWRGGELERTRLENPFASLAG